MKEHAAAALFLVCAGCSARSTDANPSSRLTGSAIPSPLLLPRLATSTASAREPPPAEQLGDPDAGCTYDWVDLGEAYRACPASGDSSTPWVPRVRTTPKDLAVASGGSLRFTVALGSDGRGPWTADLNDRCGLALRPLLLDARELPLEDLSSTLPPICPPGRARVTLSSRGAITTQLVVKAVRNDLERVVVGHRTLPGGRVEDVVEMKEREVALAPGAYFIELQLPTGDAQVVKLPLQITGPP